MFVIHCNCFYLTVLRSFLAYEEAPSAYSLIPSFISSFVTCFSFSTFLSFLLFLHFCVLYLFYITVSLYL